MKKLLVIQLRPEDEVADNELEAFLRIGKVPRDQMQRLRAEEYGLLKTDAREYSATIVGGSPFDMSKADSEKSDIQKQVEAEIKDFLDIVIEHDLPFLGACSGNSLLGNYCGAKISDKYREDVAGVDMTITDEGSKDPLLFGMPETIRVLAGHKEACEQVPDGAVLLGSTKPCPVHMFRIKKNIYATQFHPEADPQVFGVRINYYKNNGYFPAEDAEDLKASLEGEETPYAKEILERFCARYHHSQT